MMPKVSIIVPVHNTAKYLPICLDSLLKQTLSDIEIVCINDGSQDNSLEVLNHYATKDNRIKIIDFKENRGVSVARNSGIEASIGEYIGFSDSDDFVDSDFYKKLYTKAKDTEADIAKGDLKEIFPNGKIKLYNQNENILKYQNKFCFYLSFTSAIYKSDLIKKKKVFFDHRLVHTEDLVWLNRIVRISNKVEIVPDTYYNYLRRDDSTDTQILSLQNAASAYVGWKHIFLNTKKSENSQSDNSFCYQMYFHGILSFIFRSPNIKYRSLFCKLLFFFYHSCFGFYDSYLNKKMPPIYSFFKENKLTDFIDFLKDQHSYSDFIFARLRYNLRQKKSESAPKLSIIIPVYNVQNYIKKCLDSICKQTYKNLEIICVDDCSTDDSLAVLKEYARQDARVRVIQRDQNGGQAAARQMGIDAATGDYIGFVDSDDWIDEDYYEKMIERAQRDQTDIVINGSITDHVGDKTGPHNFPGHNFVQRKIYDHPSQLIDKFFCVVWNKLFKAKFLKARKYTIPQRSPHEDVFFHYATFAFADNLSFFDGPPYHYLHRETSISKIVHDWGVEHIKVYSQIYDFYKENNLLNKKIKLYATMPFFVIKTEEMFNEYKNYFQKVVSYLNENPDLFSEADLFAANTISKCIDYKEYKANYPESLMMIYLRKKR